MDRFSLAYGQDSLKDSPPPLEEEGSYWYLNLKRPLLEGLINQWLWVHMAARKSTDENGCMEWLEINSETIKCLIINTEMELRSGGTAASPPNVAINDLWSRQDLLRRYLESLIGVCIDPPNQCLSSFWVELSLVALDVLYEIKRQEDGSCVHPTLPCNGNRLAEALIRVVSNFAHSIIKVPHCIPIEKTLFDLFDSEGVFYMLKPRYRTHLFHVIDVCMLGHWFIENVAMFGTDKVNLAAWYTAALTHDIGYLAESINFVEGMLGKLDGNIFHKMREIIRRAKSEAETAVKKSKTSKLFSFDSTELMFEHGLAGGLHMFEVLSQFGLGQEDWYKQAIKAIVHHNRTSPRINILKDPFSSLLLLCDELQEWGRPGVEDRHLRRSIAASAVFGRSQLNWSNEAFGLKIKVSDTGKEISIKLDYGKNERKSFISHYIWAGKIQKLERLEWPDDIKVNVTIITKSERQEMTDFMQDVSISTELDVLRPMIESIRTETDRRLKYFKDDPVGGLFTDKLKIKLHEICNAPHRLLPTSKQKLKEALKAYSDKLEKKDKRSGSA